MHMKRWAWSPSTSFSYPHDPTPYPAPAVFPPPTRAGVSTKSRIEKEMLRCLENNPRNALSRTPKVMAMAGLC